VNKQMLRTALSTGVSSKHTWLPATGKYGSCRAACCAHALLHLQVDAGCEKDLVLGDPKAPRFVFWEQVGGCLGVGGRQQ
jgi:hypothetical protein